MDQALVADRVAGVVLRYDLQRPNAAYPPETTLACTGAILAL